jgi:hypothetical protein
VKSLWLVKKQKPSVFSFLRENTEVKQVLRFAKRGIGGCTLPKNAFVWCFFAG